MMTIAEERYTIEDWLEKAMPEEKLNVVRSLAYRIQNMAHDKIPPSEWRLTGQWHNTGVVDNTGALKAEVIKIVEPIYLAVALGALKHD